MEVLSMRDPAVGHKEKEEDGRREERRERAVALNAATAFLYRSRSRALPFSLFFHA